LTFNLLQSSVQGFFLDCQKLDF